MRRSPSASWSPSLSAKSRPRPRADAGCRAGLLAAALALTLALTPVLSAQTTPATITRDAGIEQRVGERVPADLAFRDESGRPVTLSRFFGGEGGKPTILLPAYYTCPDLCPMSLRHLTEALNAIAPVAGRDFHVVVVSFDPHDTPAAAAAQRPEYLRAYKAGRGGAGAAGDAGAGGASGGWHFLTGAPESIDALKRAIGYHCTYDPGRKRFAHAAGLVVVTAGGRLSHYFYGTDYPPADLEAALKDAAGGRATRAAVAEQQYCFAYDPKAGKYGRIITRALQAGGAAWLLALTGYIGMKLAQERRGPAQRDAAAQPAQPGQAARRGTR